MVRCVLRVRQVTAWSALRGRDDEPGMLNWLEWIEDRSRLAINTVTGPKHLLDVKRVDVEVDVTDEIDHYVRVRVGRFVGGETECRIPAVEEGSLRKSTHG